MKQRNFNINGEYALYLMKKFVSEDAWPEMSNKQVIKYYGTPEFKAEFLNTYSQEVFKRKQKLHNHKPKKKRDDD